MTMLVQIKEYFRDRGVTTSDLPKVILTHELFSVAFLALTWAACYQIQPSQSPVFAPINKTLQKSNNAFIVKSRQSFEGLLSKAERRISHEWLSKRGIDSGRVAVSLAESTVFRKAIKPITIPGKLWLTLKTVQGMGMRKGGGGGGGGRKGARKAAGKQRQQQQPPPAGAEAAAPGGGRGAGGGGERRRRDTTVIEKERGWWERGPARTGSGGGRGTRSSAPSSMKAGWGWGRSGRRRKAICPPGSRGGGRAPGCFVPAATPPGCFVPALPASALLRRGGRSAEARLR